MLRIVPNKSVAQASSYYSTADYYTGGQELVGRWHGKGAERLGLSGEVAKEDWAALCDNRHPDTGLPLTARRKDERRVGYDFNFHVPKSLSLLYGLSRDERILDAFRDAVDQTMHDMEAEMQTRVRQSGRNEDRTTGNMVWGEFVHFTSRPIDGVPDPHLHAHCFAFNVTHDSVEDRWKAGQFAGLKRDGPFFEATFHARLTRGLAELGIGVERTTTGWEVTGVPPSAIDKFSRRTAAIEREAKERGIVDPRQKDALGAKTRERKQKGLTPEDLTAEWDARLSDAERAGVAGVRDRIGGPRIGEDAALTAEAVVLAVSHCFERQSVVPERTLQAEAIKRSIGRASAESVLAELAQRKLLVAERDGRRLVTTPEILAEERWMIAFARDGRGTCRRLGSADHVFRDQRLNEGQRRAVLHVLTSPDRVMLIRGAAGVGKTTMMQEAVAAIEAGGTKVFTFAPSAGASRGVLRNEGFDDADTVARLLKDEKLQEKVKGGVLWVDEAGLLGTKTTGEVFDLARKLGTRVILSGDRRQHGSVERGAALRLLETEAGVIPSEIKEIQRQRAEYKQAVLALSEGRTEDGFRQLDDLKWIHEVDAAERYKMLAGDYVGAVKAGKTALVVSPTHAEGERITGEIRTELRQSGHLGTEERTVNVLECTNWTEADRADRANYAPGHSLIFHQNAKGYQKGQRVTTADGPLPLDKAARFQVFRGETLNVAEGDVLRVTKNGATKDGQRLNNGDLVTVHGFTPSGDIVIGNNGRAIAKDFGHLAYGYVVTSHASQGKSVQRVFLGQSSDSFGAASREQFYVSVSRGKESVAVYTDSKEELLDAVERSDERLTATEFLSPRERSERGMMTELAQVPPRVPEPVRSDRRREELAHER